MQSREITTLPLPQLLINSLVENGFYTVQSLQGVRVVELSKELHISIDDAQSILQCLENATSECISQSAMDIIAKRSVGRPIVSFCRDLDSSIGGGFPIGQITELCGIPGSGKTQLAFQLAVDVQIPEIFGGNGGEVIFIDTEGSFMVERVAEIATAMSLHLSKISKSRKMDQKARESGIDIASFADSITMQRLLEGIHFYRVHDQTELIALINQLPGILATNSKIRLLVIDSIAFHFRQRIQDTAHRSRLLGSIAQQLNQVAFKNNVAVIVTNHMTTKFEGSSATVTVDRGAVVTASNVSSFGPDSMPNTQKQQQQQQQQQQQSLLPLSSAVVPALGEIWSHCVTNRILLQYRSDQDRTATILKSPGWRNACSSFAISSAGIRDVIRGDSQELAADPAGSRKRKSEES